MPTDPTTTMEQLLTMERTALGSWCRGDPSGFLAISAPDVVYFDPFLDQRLDGLPALATYYESLRGQISAESFDLLNPVVQVSDSMAVMTFHFVSTTSDGAKQRWNCTEVYRRDAAGWRIIQTHWSLTKPLLGGASSS